MLAAAAAYDLDDPALKTSFAGIDLASPIGLAAIFDKNRELIGATCVDLYSAFIYRGWSVARRINTEFAALLRQQHAAARAPDAGADARPVGARASPRKLQGSGSSIL
jgi:hypothetical protein